jgi:hypothetical protein
VEFVKEETTYFVHGTVGMTSDLEAWGLGPVVLSEFTEALV